MEPTNDYRKDLSGMSKRTLPGFSFVCAGEPSGSGAQSRPVSADCEGQCLSGCKDECITVSK